MKPYQPPRAAAAPDLARAASSATRWLRAVAVAYLVGVAAYAAVLAVAVAHLNELATSPERVKLVMWTLGIFGGGAAAMLLLALWMFAAASRLRRGVASRDGDLVARGFVSLRRYFILNLAGQAIGFALAAFGT